jgi:hypothetical protein
MKKVIVLCFALLVYLIPAFLFASSCDSAEAEYYINFTLEGQEYSLTLGYTDVDTGDPMVVVWPSIANGEAIEFFATDVETDYVHSGEDPSNVIDIEGFLYPYTEGEYIGKYALAPNGVEEIVGWGNFHLYIIENDIYYHYVASGYLTITAFGAVGEAVEGSFDVIVNIVIDLMEAGGFGPLFGEDSYDITGSFRLKRFAWEDMPDL